MAKFYSLLLILLLAFQALQAQNIGINTNNPQETLDVNGAIKIGNTTNAFEGTIRYNPITLSFEGRNDTAWISLAGGQDSDWLINGDNMASGVSGNVGIGTNVPFAKLMVETDSMFTIGGSTTLENGFGVVGLANRYPTFPPDFRGAGGLFYGHHGVFGASTDSAGYAVFGQHYNGGYAGRFMGDVSIEGAIRNLDDSKFNGSVAINDGVTIGEIEGSSCFPNIADNLWLIDTTGNFSFFGGGGDSSRSQTYDTTITYGQLKTDTTRDCFTISNVYYETTFYDFGGFEINVELYLRDEFIGKIDIADALVYNNNPIPGSFISLDTASGGSAYYSTWGWNRNIWNGTDPTGVNWTTYAVNYGFDTDYWHSYRIRVDYEYGDSTSAPLYADFGDLRATGTLYANSTSAYGDVAEFFKVDKRKRLPEPGDIVSISPDNPQTFVLAHEKGDPLLAGVISENPSVFLNDPSAGEPIALTGRVKVKVNAEGGKIKLGDAITSSSVLGVGMKANDNGIILGRALEAFDGSNAEQGKIWILLAAGHYEKISPEVKVVEGDKFSLKGTEISGSKSVKADQALIKVLWSDATDFEIPKDVEFEDLVIDLTSFGGGASMYIANVDEEGFEVQIENRSDKFKGFYYRANILSTQLNFPSANQGKTGHAGAFDSEDLLGMEKRRKEIAQYFESTTGASLKAVPGEKMTEEKAKSWKYGVINTWKQKDSQLYNEYVTLGKTMYEIKYGN